ncbi:Asp-tRNA(Asn)/Glu-tRNA(Gln) amidotransferase subunit GatA [Aerococcaceae bacterium DSM 109653]|uniref:Glutamyl-tRNA(Gln) amidotransferase subunit A n=1 Tax=Fundicoccus ignavus TaxID=2664442 RepID=A0A6I2GD78_9LACT|nr:Asp-tRNA(Asn)/Glu-tRNA(Gln) amidotransferase subunit GatA [Fundicoccus ignavus]MRI82010.1 Asp-tRNA(Asn)/Glu-tRNA(Gln) amidotransferase subunit GatA [Fundicoccus ignavus]MRI85750.1 Asp-tRNA(Asn)/Glu-tRNA(Gln) amidotransferase subunit GatA [Fundicoccus ignavus]
MSKFPTTIKELKAGLKAGEFTAVELLEYTYQQIAALEPKVEAYLEIDAQRAVALEAAKAADERGYGEDAPLLNGIPIAVKDNIVTQNLRTTAASKMLENFVPTYDATTVERLKAAGAVIVGKLNLDEFAMGGSNEKSAFKVTHNPWNLNKVPGGSSGASAATVAARQVPASLGTDTGGSIRQPASYNGVVGIKPTYGSVSRFGLIAFGSSLDTIGPMTLTVEDNALVLEAIAGYDEKDSTSLQDIDTNYSAKIGQSLAGMKIAFPKEFKSEEINEEVREAMEAAADFYRSEGAIVEEVSLPYSKYGVDVYYIIASAEASSNLQRFDGIRYGHRSEAAESLEDVYVLSRSEAFGDEVKRRIMLGTYSLSSGAYDAFFDKAARVRTLIRQDFDKVFAEYDVIMGPVTTSTAFDIGGRVNNPLEMYVADLLTIPVNLIGAPAISVPAGFDSEKLPIGLQLIGKPLDEATLYQVAHAYEVKHDYASQAPEL